MSLTRLTCHAACPSLTAAQGEEAEGQPRKQHGELGRKDRITTMVWQVPTTKIRGQSAWLLTGCPFGVDLYLQVQPTGGDQLPGPVTRSTFAQHGPLTYLTFPKGLERPWFY